MKVAFLPGTFRPDRCGVSHYTARLLEELARQGVEGVVLTTHAAAREHARPEVVGSASGWGAQLLLSLPATLRRLRVDLLHVQHAASSFGFRRPVLWLLPALRAAGWRRPVVVTLHEYGWWPWRPRVLGWAWQRLGPWGEARGLWDREGIALLTWASAVIVANEAARAALAGRLPRVAARAECLPIGSNIRVLASDVAAARARLRERLAWAPDAPVIAYFGFLHPVKGLETLLGAFAQVLRREPGARLLLIGGAESLALEGDRARSYAAGLRALAQELGVASAVRFTGYLPEALVSEHLAGADVGVLAFNQGVTLKSGSLMAMWAHGLPVVATRPAACPEELERAAWLVPARDPRALAEALVHLLGDAPARQALGARARQAASGFAWPAIAERHLAIYRRLMGRGRDAG